MNIAAFDHAGVTAAFFAEATGATIGIARWRHLDRGRKWITAWMTAAILADAGNLVAARLLHNNQFVARIWFLASVTCACESLVAYQRDRRRSAWLRSMWIGYVVAWIAMAVTIEPLTSLQHYLAPLQSSILLATGAATMVRRFAISRHPLLCDAPFLISAALVGYAAPELFISAVLRTWVTSRPELVVIYYSLFDWVATLAELLMLRALLLDAPSAQPVFAS